MRSSFINGHFLAEPRSPRIFACDVQEVRLGINRLFFVRPCSVKKLLISEMDTFLPPFFSWISNH